MKQKRRRKRDKRTAAGATARQRLAEERLRVILKNWDAGVKALLWRAVKTTTWDEGGKSWTIKRKVGSDPRVGFGIHWKAGWSEGEIRTGYDYSYSEFFRISLLLLEDNFSPTGFVVECKGKKRKIRHIKAGVSAEELEAAVLEASIAGPAELYYIAETLYR
jgi:hypothetical protein